MSQGARFVLNSRYFHIAQPGEPQNQYAMLGSHIENLVEYAGTRETVALNFDKVTAEQPATKEQEKSISKLIRLAGLKNNKIDDVLEYNDYKENPTVQNASQLIAYLAEQTLINGAFDEVSNLIEYTAERPGAVKVGEHGLFSSTPNVDLEQAKKELSQHKGNIYTHILSLRREDADRLGYDSQAPWRNLILSKIDVIAKTHNIDINDLHWYAAMHNTGHHPHIHLFVYSNEEAKTPYFSNDSIKVLKSSFANEIFREEMHNIENTKSEYRQTINDKSKELLNTLLENPLKSYESEQLNNLLNKINELAEKLPEHGRMVYGYMPKSVKELVDDIQRHLVYDNKILNELYMEYCNCQYNIEQMYINNPKYASVDKIKDFTVIKNDIIKNALKIRNENSFEKAMREQKITNEIYNEPTNNSKFESKINTNEFYNFTKEEIPQNQYKTTNYRKRLNYKVLEKKYPFLKDFNFDGTPTDKKFQSLDYLCKSIREIRTGEMCRELADCYYYGNGCEREINQAVLWYGIAADEFKDSYAQYRLGEIYFNGTDEIKIDKKLGNFYSYEAYSNFVSEIKNSDFFFSLKSGIENLYYDKKVSADDAYKEYLIGRLYFKGHGVEQDYNKAFLSFSLSAENGYAHANYYIGNMFYYGLGFEQNYKKAFEYYNKASEKGDSYADYRLGIMYQNGEGVDVDLKTTEKYFKKSVDKVVMSNYALATLYESNKNIFNKEDEDIFTYYERALDGFLKQEKEMHDSFTEVRIGKMYQNGKGTDVNIEKAVEWYEKAAQTENPDALYQLALIYGSEQFSAKDGEKSFNCYAQALKGYIKAEEEYSNANAEYRIGKMYLDGQGTDVNIDEGKSWLEKSALNNNPQAGYLLYKLYSEGEQIEKNIPRAMAFLEISAYLDNPYAQFTFGKIKIEEKNIAEGIKWLTASAEKEVSYANYRLGEIYSSNEYGVFDEIKAKTFYAKSLNLFESEYGELPSEYTAYQIGSMYQNGKGTDVNIEKAVEWYEKAAQAENPDALYQLGYIYKNSDYKKFNENLSYKYFHSAYVLFSKNFEENPNEVSAYKIATMFHYGLGIDRDIEKAVSWYIKSAELGYEKAKNKINEIEEQRKADTLAIASTVAHFGRIIDTETHAAFKQRYVGDRQILKQEKIKKINAGQAVDDNSYDYDY